MARKDPGPPVDRRRFLTGVVAAEAGTPREPARVPGIPGSDFMVGVIKTLDIKYGPSNCASSYRAIHESMINDGANRMPEFLTS